jgi:hypothetical protein
MSKTLGYSLLAIFAAMSVAISAARPQWVSDDNSFMKNFVNHELLALLGVILAITLASIASVHLEFNKIEERNKKRFLSRSRTNLRKNAYWLISLFAIAVVVVTIKPILCGGAVAQALANMSGMLILLWHVLILITLTQLVFSIEPEIDTPPQ